MPAGKIRKSSRGEGERVVRKGKGFIYFLRFYLFERARVITEGGGEADSLLNAEPYVGLNSRTLRS